MQKWEYLFVTSGNVNDIWKAISVNEQEVKKSIHMYKYAKQLGERGWELVNCAPVFSQYAKTLELRFYFKRPLETKPVPVEKKRTVNASELTREELREAIERGDPVILEGEQNARLLAEKLFDTKPD
jgi:hypothetical protein